MRRGMWVVVVGTLVLLCALPLAAQDANQMKVVNKASLKFATPPGLPACATAAVDEGDPSKGQALFLVKATSGCVVPMHWHTANENLMIVSGSGKLEMKDGKPEAVASGDYAYMPAKQAHQFTATSATTFFLYSDGKFDIHYVDASGNEIPPEQALKSSAGKAKMGKAKKPAAK